mgnify:CR=1 FL=1
MSKGKFAAFVAALILSVGTTAAAQSAQAALKAPPHMSRAQLVVWCRIIRRQWRIAEKFAAIHARSKLIAESFAPTGRK